MNRTARYTALSCSVRAPQVRGGSSRRLSSRRTHARGVRGLPLGARAVLGGPGPCPVRALPPRAFVTPGSMGAGVIKF